MKPILLIGGYGDTGRKTAQQLRLRHPDVPLAIAGRNLAAAQTFADWLVSGAGQDAIAAYTVADQQLFFPNAPAQ